MEVRRRLGRNVKAARQALGLSQEGLAFDCGLHRTYVSGVERGIRNPTVTVLDKLAAALKTPPGRLLDEPAEEVAGDGSGKVARTAAKASKAKPADQRDRDAAKASASD